MSILIDVIQEVNKDANVIATFNPGEGTFDVVAVITDMQSLAEGDPTQKMGNFMKLLDLDKIGKMILRLKGVDEMTITVGQTTGKLKEFAEELLKFVELMA